MNFKNLIIILIVCILGTNVIAHAQITKRERPSQWEHLVYGGRFMDRFLPMPVMGKLTSDTWGAKAVIPRYTQNGIEDNINSYWGGNVIISDDGKFHLFVCGWPENSPKGHMYWKRSTVFHAVADNSFGPYELLDSIGAGHNPEVFQLSDGRYVIYIINGYYIGESLNGPWVRKEFDFQPRDRKIIEGLSNMTFAQREDGSYIAICRGGGVWFSKTGISSYHQVTDKRIYPSVDGRFEDPLIWKTNVQYHLIVNDWYGRIAWYLRSKDGINWKVDQGEAYLPGIAKYEDGTKVDWYKYERIKVLQDEYGRAMQAHFAVIDTVKWNDLENDNHSSKQIVIPLVVGRLISVTNNSPITADTKTIQVKIEAEHGFNPHNDIDINSLRFGAPEEVNFGRGCTVMKTNKSGKDLIVFFDGKGNGFSKENFAGKLLGKTNDGKLLFGYSRLPAVTYIESALSARRPVIRLSNTKSKVEVEVEVQNFGQVSSDKTQLKVLYYDQGKEVELVSAELTPLKSFEKTIISIITDKKIKEGKEYRAKVIIDPEGKMPNVFDTIIGL